jgi:hypothetical protein
MEIPAIQPNPRIAEVASQTRDQGRQTLETSQPAAMVPESEAAAAQELQPAKPSLGETFASRVGIVPMTFVSGELARDHQRSTSSKELKMRKSAEPSVTPPRDPDPDGPSL